jgi:molecular chaperone Hsp33
MADQLFKFLFDGAEAQRSSVRGEIVALEDAWREIYSRHDYPAPVLRLLGEMVAASALLTANLKFNGTLIMQIHGDGPLRLLVVECNADLTLRATAKLADDAVVDDDSGFAQLVNTHGRGRFVMTLDPRDRRRGQQPYQGVVPLEGDSVADALGNYMLRSEQLDTHLWLAADEHCAKGMLLQRLPQDGGTPANDPTLSDEDADLARAQETWRRAITLANTLERAELLAATPETLMHRLFWEETLRVFEPLSCVFACSCSRERVGAMLLTLGRPEVDATLEQEGHVLVHCEFCNKGYEFDRVDCVQLFATSNPVDGVRSPLGQRH